MLNAIRVQEKLVRNKYEIKKKTFEINIKSTEFNEDMLSRKVSNIEEFFDVIDWKQNITTFMGACLCRHRFSFEEVS